MPRVTLIEQQSYEFNFPLTVRRMDINSAGHLGCEALLELVTEARAHFLKQLNFNAQPRGGRRIGLIVADFADDQLTVVCHIDELREKSFRIFHRIRRGNQVIALVETGIVAYDYRFGHVVQLPDKFLAGLQN